MKIRTLTAIAISLALSPVLLLATPDKRDLEKISLVSLNRLLVEDVGDTTYAFLEAGFINHNSYAVAIKDETFDVMIVGDVYSAARGWRSATPKDMTLGKGVFIRGDFMNTDTATHVVIPPTGSEPLARANHNIRIALGKKGDPATTRNLMDLINFVGNRPNRNTMYLEGRCDMGVQVQRTTGNDPRGWVYYENLLFRLVFDPKLENAVILE